MRMKRVLVFVLVIVFAMSLMAGCGGSGDNDTAGKTTLTFWCHIDNVWNAEQDKIIDEFMADNPDIVIQKEAFPYDDFEQKTQTSLMEKSGGADIYSLWGGWAVDYASTGVFSPVPEDFIDGIIEDSYDPVLGGFEYDGQYYGIPLEFNNEYGGMLVSVPKFKEFGIDYPTTWDDMISIAKEHTVREGNLFKFRGFDFPAWDATTYIWLSMILSSGGEYMTDDDQFNFSTPIGIKTMQEMVDYVVVDQITNTEGITGGEEMEPYQKFYLGDSLMVPRGPWVVPEGWEEYDLTYGEDYEYVSMPFYGEDKLFAAETGWGLAVNANSDNQDAAWKFVEFWSEKDRLLEYNKACGLIPPYKSLAHDPSLIEEMPYLEPLIDILDGGKFIGYFNTDILKEAVSNMFVDLCENGGSVEDAVKSLDDTLNNG